MGDDVVVMPIGRAQLAEIIRPQLDMSELLPTQPRCAIGNLTLGDIDPKKTTLWVQARHADKVCPVGAPQLKDPAEVGWRGSNAMKARQRPDTRGMRVHVGVLDIRDFVIGLRGGYDGHGENATLSARSAQA